MFYNIYNFNIILADMVKLGGIMERSEFLKEISSMNREEINKLLEKDVKRIKKIYPVLVVTPYKYKDVEKRIKK